MPFCTELLNNLVGHLHGAAWTQPATLYVGLCTSVAADGTVTGEPAIGTNNYARAVIDNNDTTNVWGAASNGSVTNSSGIIQFNTASGNWGAGALTTFFVTDQLNATGSGVALYYGTLSSSITVVSGDQPTFNTSQLTVTLS